MTAVLTPPKDPRTPLQRRIALAGHRLNRLDPVVKNARLETVPTGALEVTFTDGSRMTLGSASSVVVDARPDGASCLVFGS